MEKTLIHFFSAFGSKINKFEQKKLAMNEKNQKTQKLSDCHYSDVINSLLNAFRLKENQKLEKTNRNLLQKGLLKLKYIALGISISVP